MKKNPVKAALKAGKPQVGTWLSFGNVFATRLMMSNSRNIDGSRPMMASFSTPVQFSRQRFQNRTRYCRSITQIPSPVSSSIITLLNLVSLCVTRSGSSPEAGAAEVSVPIEYGGEPIDIDVDHVLVFFGLAPKLGPIAEWGLDINRKTINVDTEKFETSEPGIYAVGDINYYPGKKKLILSGFHEAALAAFAAKERIEPEKKVRLQYTTTSPLMHERLELILIASQLSLRVRPRGDVDEGDDDLRHIPLFVHHPSARRREREVEVAPDVLPLDHGELLRVSRREGPGVPDRDAVAAGANVLDVVHERTRSSLPARANAGKSTLKRWGRTEVTGILKKRLAQE